MENKSFKTLGGQSEGLYKEKGSKFISFAYPVSTIQDVKSRLDELRKQFHDARHHCYAYIIETDGLPAIRAQDDGEPNHSAGDPILGQIKSFKLSNVLIVVIRYFGGTKLGVSGLIHAYKTAAEQAILSNKIITITLKAALSIIFPYERTSEVSRLIKEFSAEILSQEYTESCLTKVEVLPSQKASLTAKLNLLEGVRLLDN